MNDDRRHDDSQPLDQSAARALQALARLPRAQAPDLARTRARSLFVDDSAVNDDRGANTVSGRRGRPRWAALLMAAALGVLAVIWFGTLPDQQWVVLDVVEPGGVSVDAGGSVAVGDRLSSGLIATGTTAELELQLGDQLRFRMVPGTTLELPRAPGRWFGRDRRLELTAGEIYGTSGGQALDFGLVFATRELEARLIGTTFAVFRTSEASCVCLWTGGITVAPLAGAENPVVLEEKQRVWIYKDGRDHELKPLSDMEVMKLQMIHDTGLADSLPDTP